MSGGLFRGGLELGGGLRGEDEVDAGLRGLADGLWRDGVGDEERGAEKCLPAAVADFLFGHCSERAALIGL